MITNKKYSFVKHLARKASCDHCAPRVPFCKNRNRIGCPCY